MEAPEVLVSGMSCLGLRARERCWGAVPTMLDVPSIYIYIIAPFGV